MKTYLVTYPIAGHATFEVEAENETQAKELAEQKDMTEGDVEVSWDAIGKFNEGNVCYCPTPWETEIEEIN